MKKKVKNRVTETRGVSLVNFHSRLEGIASRSWHVADPPFFSASGVNLLLGETSDSTEPQRPTLCRTNQPELRLRSQHSVLAHAKTWEEVRKN